MDPKKDEGITAERPAYTRFTLQEWAAIVKAAAAEKRSAAGYIANATAERLRQTGYLKDE